MGQEFIQRDVLEFGFDAVFGLDQQEMVTSLLEGKSKILLGKEGVVIGNGEILDGVFAF